MKEKIYTLSPIWLKTILLNIKAKSNNKKRFTPGYYKYLYEYVNLWNSDKETYFAYQKDKLISLLLECFEFVPFYNNRLETLGIDKSQIQEDPFGVLKQLPFLSKEDRKFKLDEIVNQNPSRPVIGVGYTSGTSGSPTVNYIDQETSDRGFALWSRFHNTIGIENWNERSVRFSGNLIVESKRTKPPFWIENKVNNQLFMSTYHIKDEYLSDYVAKLNDYQPKLIDGYPSSIYIIAKFINSQNKFLSFKPLAVSVTAETLFEYQRNEIEKAFGCKVFNQYASSEGSPFITECKEGKLHINEDSGYFEFLDNYNQPAKPGEIGRMVVTSFRSYKIPLLRYDILDSVLLPELQDECKCGCKMPYVENIIGRSDDLVWTKEKGYVIELDGITQGFNTIIKSQIIQRTPTDFILNIVIPHCNSANFDSGLIIKRLKDRVGENINVRIDFVRDIPLGANGKFKFIKREFDID